jgi:hypothetical protein
MTAFHNMMLSGHGLPEMPPGGSLESRLKSRIRRLLQLVDYNQTRREQKIQERDGQNELTMTAVTGESWSLGTQRSGFSALVLHRRLVSLQWCHVVIQLQTLSCFTESAAHVFLPKIGLFSFPEMNGFMESRKLPATGT